MKLKVTPFIKINTNRVLDIEV